MGQPVVWAAATKTMPVAALAMWGGGRTEGAEQRGKGARALSSWKRVLARVWAGSRGGGPKRAIARGWVGKRSRGWVKSSTSCGQWRTEELKRERQAWPSCGLSW